MSLIRVDDVWKSFGDVAVLKGVSLAVDEGSIVTVIGRSGSGKSTLLRCINGLERIDKGGISVDGVAVHNASRTELRQLRQKLGIVFQSFNLFPHLTVERNIALAPEIVQGHTRDAARRTTHDVLRRVGLEDKIDAYPAQLSGGQQQRVAIARSLAMSPKVMLFDEITSALDPELIGEVLKVLEDLARQGMTMVLVTHEMGFARNVANTVVFMHQGKVWETGPPAELLVNPKTQELETFIKSVL